MKRALGTFGLLYAVACTSGEGRPDPKNLVGTSRPGSDPDASLIDPPPVECGGDYCGDTFLHERQNPPNLYFLIDRSGSMQEVPDGSHYDKYHMARNVITDVLSAIGHRVRYGIAIYPESSEDDVCSTSREVLEPTLGAPPSCTGQIDPELSHRLTVLGNYTPKGNTPTSAALSALVPELTELAGKTYLVLLTDGAPNCNLDAVCEADECGLNIAAQSIGSTRCSGSVNCCDPLLFGDGVQGNCVDSAETVRQLERLAEHGIPTYVIGLPGTELFADVLNRMAEAGGAAREGEASAYYDVGDQDELETALYSIGSGLAIRCSIELEEAPLDPDKVNVYFDGKIVEADPDNGWSWDGDTRIQVNGDACDALRSGAVLDARADYGCDTLVR
ncbi:MAG TPA: vWA domain-containing protein [Polyangiaceae bacterium]|nr:vWA domain-containing protein [Polyangiaceae bacterium]